MRVAREIMKLKHNKEEFLAELEIKSQEIKGAMEGNLALAREINRADAYGDSTDNYLPLLHLISGITPSDTDADRELYKVPEDWNPS